MPKLRNGWSAFIPASVPDHFSSGPLAWVGNHFADCSRTAGRFVISRGVSRFANLLKILSLYDSGL
jgi:hypothetical protein